MSRGFLLDTNIPSELTRPQPEPRVTRWLEDTDDELIYFSVVSIGEICKGLTVHPEPHRRAWLRNWLDKEMRPWLADRILPVSEAVAERWGILDGQCQLQGITLNAPDGLIAATALEHDLTVVTRNLRHFERLGVPVFNPWEQL
jgi:predicted nucleic acid-binding protein